MTREEIENSTLQLGWEYQPYGGVFTSYLSKTGLDFNLRIIETYNGYASLLKEDLNGRCIERIELDSEWKAYKLARVWQINKLCEILQIKQ